MKFVGLHRASPESWRAGVILGVIHLAIVLAFILFAARGSRDAQWELAFLPLALLDLPVAMPAYLLGFGVVWALAGFGVYPEAAIAMVVVANGLVGTVFYLILPPAISAHRRFRHGLPEHESAVA